MKKIPLIVVLAACVFLNGCMGGNSGSVANPAPVPPPGTAPSVDLMRPGDKITVRLSGVPQDEYVIEVLIPASGDITVPLLTRSFHAAGRNSAQVADEISEAYKVDQIFTNPNVTIIPEERFVNVSGDVRGPARVLYTPDMTLLTAITSCGGFDEYANRKAVRITRGSQIFTVNAVKATSVAGSDPPLYPGDQVYVPRTVF